MIGQGILEFEYKMMSFQLSFQQRYCQLECCFTIRVIYYFVLFADDTNIFYENFDKEKLEETINKLMMLKELSLWFKVNWLSLNIKKTNYIVFWFQKYRCEF